MPDFSDLPKQWIVSPAPLADPVAGKADRFAGYHLATAREVPVQTLRSAEGADLGRLIGWPIQGETLHRTDGTITLGPGQTPEYLFAELGGRFVLLWQAADGRVLLREDSAGSLPAIHAPAARLVGATVTLIDQIHSLPPAPEVEAIFDFPKRRGFLPFGLTPRQGAHRLMPNHVLDLDSMTPRRVWPDAGFAARPPLDADQISAGVAETAVLLRRHMTAILNQGETVLYLSGGQDSRTVLAAARGMTANLRAETLGDEGLLDAHVAAQVARAAVEGDGHAGLPGEPGGFEGRADVETLQVQRGGRTDRGGEPGGRARLGCRAPAVHDRAPAGGGLDQDDRARRVARRLMDQQRRVDAVPAKLLGQREADAVAADSARE